MRSESSCFLPLPFSPSSWRAPLTVFTTLHHIGEFANVLAARAGPAWGLPSLHADRLLYSSGFIIFATLPFQYFQALMNIPESVAQTVVFATLTFEKVFRFAHRIGHCVIGLCAFFR